MSKKTIDWYRSKLASELENVEPSNITSFRAPHILHRACEKGYLTTDTTKWFVPASDIPEYIKQSTYRLQDDELFLFTKNRHNVYIVVSIYYHGTSTRIRRLIPTDDRIKDQCYPLDMDDFVKILINK